eukprot:gb/GFBE01064594.1/.p1 GENE.gb/GFBE01064594.1/~~gb/GFBE01064594.1/.p1  ORF type:complete len:402 (+),score=60.72 gb/GFBE01064594.1/:1-1206(+)
MAVASPSDDALHQWLGCGCLQPIGKFLGVSRRLQSELPVAADALQAPSPKPVSRLPLPLDVGFAVVKLVESDEVPRLDIRISAAEEGEVTDDSLSAMLEFLDFALDLPQASGGEGFQLTYEVPNIGSSQIEVIRGLVCWSCEPGRQAKWLQRCKRWKIIVAEGVYHKVSKLLLYSVFYLYPPPCTTYLLTDTNPFVDDGDTEPLVFHPNADTLAIAKLGDDLQQEVASHAHQLGHAAPGEVASASAASRDWGWGEELPDVICVGFAEVHQGFDGKEAYLKIFGVDGDVSEDGLAQMMDFMDAFTLSEKAQTGFSIMYDLRSLRAASMNLVTRIAEWGAEPSRQKRWETLNHSCKVVISAGLKYTLAKGILTTFFLICPPVCRTYLMTEPDQPLDLATVFEP